MWIGAMIANEMIASNTEHDAFSEMQFKCIGGINRPTNNNKWNLSNIYYLR